MAALKLYLAATVSVGAWIAADDGAPLWEVAASALSGPVLAPAALAFNLYCTLFER
jgi:hypothetical protein